MTAIKKSITKDPFSSHYLNLQDPKLENLDLIKSSVFFTEHDTFSSLTPESQLLLFVRKHDVKLAKVKSLETISILDLRNQGLTELPDNLHLLINLEYLYVGGNKLVSLPESLNLLPKLKEVHLYNEDNKFTSLPLKLTSKESLTPVNRYTLKKELTIIELRKSLNRYTELPEKRMKDLEKLRK